MQIVSTRNAQAQTPGILAGAVGATLLGTAGFYGGAALGAAAGAGGGAPTSKNSRKDPV